MKRLIWSLVLLISLTLTGCIHKTNITGEESDAVAEYMAGLLLKYDDEYDKELLPKDDIEANIKNNETGDNNTNENNTDSSDASDKTSDVKEDEVDSQEAYSFTDIVDQKNFDISYSGYMLTDLYPEDYDNTYISVEADKGQQLLVIKFNIKNKTKKAKSINLSETELKYQLEIDSNKIEKPWFTVLENDIQYIDMKIDSEGSIEAVLVYQISKKADTTNMKLMISNDEKQMNIPIR